MLPIRSGQKLPQEPVFQRPPLWIHEAVAAKCFLRNSASLVKPREERKVPCSPAVSKRSARS
jgi:hypothetical protein